MQQHNSCCCEVDRLQTLTSCSHIAETTCQCTFTFTSMDDSNNHFCTGANNEMTLFVREDKLWSALAKSHLPIIGHVILLPETGAGSPNEYKNKQQQTVRPYVARYTCALHYVVRSVKQPHQLTMHNLVLPCLILSIEGINECS